MHLASVSWQIVSLKFSSWNIISFEQKQPINVQVFKLWSPLMNVHPLLLAIFETTRSEFVQFCITLWCHQDISSVTLWCHQDISSVFFSSSLIYFRQKEPIEVNFSNCWVLEWEFKFLMSYLKLPVNFYLDFASLFSIMIDNSSVLS